MLWWAGLNVWTMYSDPSQLLVRKLFFLSWSDLSCEMSRSGLFGCRFYKGNWLNLFFLREVFKKNPFKFVTLSQQRGWLGIKQTVYEKFWKIKSTLKHQNAVVCICLFWGILARYNYFILFFHIASQVYSGLNW